LQLLNSKTRNENATKIAKWYNGDVMSRAAGSRQIFILRMGNVVEKKANHIFPFAWILGLFYVLIDVCLFLVVPQV
jgi:hypothetical protein